MIQIDIKMPIGCIYEGDNGKTEYCPLCNHDDVPYCQYLDDDEASIGIGERPCYCPLYKSEESRKKGKWIEHHEPYTWMGNTYWTCSKCNFGEKEENKERSNFCPHCGADMREEADE